MFSWLRRVLGGAQDSEAAAGETEHYQGYDIVARVQPEGSQYRCAGTISRDGVSVPFVRADLLSDRSQAEQHALRKAKQIIDEQGESLLQRSRV